MAGTVQSYCSHLESTPHAPLPPGYASSFASFSPLEALYFCEECDAIRCNRCISAEVASYYCPSCLFDVPSHNVRTDKNRCARSCFQCPQCASGLSTIGSDAPAQPEGEEGSSTARYSLMCAACKWSSKEVGWQFDKASGLAAEKIFAQSAVHGEYDALKDHLDKYIALSGPQAAPVTKDRRHARTPSRHIAHLAASRALGRDVPGLPPLKSTARGARFRRGADGEKLGGARDEMAPYAPKESWREAGLERGLGDVDAMAQMHGEDIVPVERRWASSWDPNRLSKNALPQRVPLQTRMMKRCPSCRHIIVQPQPDSKSVRMPIKTVAFNYIPRVELGRRRHRVGEGSVESLTEDEREKRRRDRRRTRAPGAREGEDESMDAPLRAGEVYTFQLAFTNPLYDPIQIKVGLAHQAKPPLPPNHHVHISSSHFTVGALKDAWAYDEEDEDDDMGSDEGGGVDERSKRMSLGPSMHGGHRHRGRDVEKRGNVTKVGLEVEVNHDALGPVEFDLEVRFTYRADDEGDGGDKDKTEAKAEYKTFTFWARVCAGEVG